MKQYPSNNLKLLTVNNLVTAIKNYDYDIKDMDCLYEELKQKEDVNEELDDLAGFSVAIQAEGNRVYTILVYPLKGYSIQDCIAVQYAGDEDYFYFYAIS